MEITKRLKKRRRPMMPIITHIERHYQPVWPLTLNSRFLERTYAIIIIYFWKLF